MDKTLLGTQSNNFFGLLTKRKRKSLESELFAYLSGYLDFFDISNLLFTNKILYNKIFVYELKKIISNEDFSHEEKVEQIRILRGIADEKKETGYNEFIRLACKPLEKVKY